MMIGTPQIRTTVGAVEGKLLRFLAHVPMCSGDACPIRDQCSFRIQGRCKVLYSFLESLYTDWVDPKNGIGDQLTQFQLDRIGTHLMPLYHQLARYALEISSLAQTTYENKQGNILAYPQFKELREVLRSIREEMRELQLDKLWRRKFKGSKSIPDIDIDQIMQVGLPGAYEAMEQRTRQRVSPPSESS